jgi:hypothetical protein
VLKAWIELDSLATLSRRFGIVRTVSWQTNQVPVVDDAPSILQGKEDLPEILRLMKMMYEAALLPALDASVNNEDLRIGLLLLREFMRRNGLDPDPKSLVAKVTAHFAQKKLKAQDTEVRDDR